jgi:site-specific DNA recombinase
MSSKLRAVIYARVSTAEQARKSARDPAEGSCETQLQLCRVEAKRLGATVVGEYKDEGITGTANDRPEYMELLAAAARGEFELILANEQSRLWRNEAETHRCVEDMLYREIRIVTRDGYDSSNDATSWSLTVKAKTDADDVKRTAKRVYEEHMKKAKAGRIVGGCPYGYRHRHVTNPSQLDRHGNAVVLEIRREINPEQAKTVRRIFKDFAEGRSCRDIATELNDAGIPSPGSTWARKTRRCSGWVANAVYSMLQNPMYCGQYIWNRVKWKKPPGKKMRKQFKRRPSEDWIVTAMPQLRIIDEELWERVRVRVRARKNDNPKLKCGGKSRYVLSGLLRCGECGAHFTLNCATHYRCASVDTNACSNTERLRRDVAEDLLLRPILNDLLDPRMVALMAKEMQSYYAERAAELQTKAASRPAELVTLDARIARLKERVRAGDPDMTTDELQATIDRAQGKREELLAAQPEARASAKILTLLPKAAALYRKQILEGLDGDPRAAARARAAVRQLIGGEYRLKFDRAAGHLVAHFGLNRLPLLRAAGAGSASLSLGAGTNGSGGALCHVPTVPQHVRVK